MSASVIIGANERKGGYRSSGVREMLFFKSDEECGLRAFDGSHARALKRYWERRISSKEIAV